MNLTQRLMMMMMRIAMSMKEMAMSMEEMAMSMMEEMKIVCQGGSIPQLGTYFAHDFDGLSRLY
ncbi:MAG: hypothetical protein CBC48_04985 [bacterium TMED88]|nr:MAG: hypothetical protein CBC48_04985 [bacterium TMED88]